VFFADDKKTHSDSLLYAIVFLQMIRELSSYDSHVNSSFEFAWKLREEQEDLVFFPSPTYGIDANTTFEVSTFSNNRKLDIKQRANSSDHS